jgi:membrane protein
MNEQHERQDEQWPGEFARRPFHIPWRGWWHIARRVWWSIGEDNIPLMAAGLAFYSMLALFPLLIAAITVYGLVSDPGEVPRTLELITGTMSGGAGEIIGDQLEQIVAASPGALTWGLAASLAVIMWSASTGTLNLLKAVNQAYGERESRGFFHLRALAFVMTMGAILFIAVAVALIAILPAVLGVIGLDAASQAIVKVVRWPLLLFFGMAAVAVIYRLGPDRRSPRVGWLTVGAVVAVALWLLASGGFSIYVQNFGSYNETYGSLGSVIVLLMWFFLTGFSILLGAEVNAAIEMQTGIDTTVGDDRPRGQRRAVMADRTPLDRS